MLYILFCGLNYHVLFCLVLCWDLVLLRVLFSYDFFCCFEILILALKSLFISNMCFWIQVIVLYQQISFQHKKLSQTQIYAELTWTRLKHTKIILAVTFKVLSSTELLNCRILMEWYCMFTDSEMDEKEWKPLSEEQDNAFHLVFCWCRGVKIAQIKEIEQEDWKI
jgi:hypothetical protein